MKPEAYALSRFFFKIDWPKKRKKREILKLLALEMKEAGLLPTV